MCIEIDVEETRKIYAKSIGKFTKQLTDKEKKQAFLDAILARAKNKEKYDHKEKFKQMTEKNKPVPKVGAMGISGILAILIIWALNTYGSVKVPPEMAALLTAAIGFTGGYIMPDKKAKKIKDDYEDLLRKLSFE